MLFKIKTVTLTEFAALDLGEGKVSSDVSIAPAPNAIVHHPWWDDAAVWSMIKRHYNWARGDGILLEKHPKFTFLSFPNSVELLLLLPLLLLVTFPSWTILLKLIVGLVVADIAATVMYCVYHAKDQFQEQFRDCRFKWTAMVVAAVIRRASDGGRLATKLKRRQWSLLCRRFDWFTGFNQGSVSSQRYRDLWHLMCITVVEGAVMYWWT